MSLAGGLLADQDELAEAAEVAAHRTRLEELHRSHYQSLVRLAAIMLSDLGAAEEVTQEAFLRAYQAHGRLREPDRLLDYLRSSVLNGSRSRLRRRRVAGIGLTRLQAMGAPPESTLVADDRDLIIRLVRRLPARQRECLVLRHYLDLSEAEAARTLGISPGSVKQHLHRALATIGRRMGGEA